MAIKQFYHDIDLVKLGQLVNARLQNIADQTEQDALAATLGPANEGLVIYRADLNVIYVWDGAAFIGVNAPIEGDVIFKGVVDASISLDGQVEPVSGYQYVVGTAGTATATGVTFSPDALVEVGDVILFTSPTQAFVVQRNDVEATETVLGNVRLASQAEVNAGVQATEAVTPATLQGKLVAQKYVKQYDATLNLTAATPATVSHGLNLVNRDAFTINVMLNNSAISVDVDSVDANTLTLTSLVSLTGVAVTVQGAVAA